MDDLPTGDESRPFGELQCRTAFLGPKVCFFVSVPSEFPVQMALASQISPERAFFIFNFQAYDLEPEAVNTARSGYRHIRLLSPRSRSAGTISPPLCRNPSPTLRSLLESRRNMVRVIEEILTSNQVAALVLSNNKSDFLSPYVLFAARRAGCATVFLPFGRDTADSYASKVIASQRSNPKGARVALHWKLILNRWLLRDSEGSVLVQPPEEIIAMAAIGCSPPLPRSPYGGNAGHILAESAAMAKHYRSLSPITARIHQTGSPNDDLIFRVRHRLNEAKTELCGKSGLNVRRPIISTSPPQHMKDFLGRIDVRQRDYVTFLREFVNDLCECAPDANILCSIHPRSRAVVNFPLPRNAAVIEGSVTDIIPLSDFYVGSQTSTFRLSVGCGIPSIDYDVYGLGFNFYSSEDGVELVRDRKELRNTVRNWARGEEAFTKAKANALVRSGIHAQLDGGASSRILEKLAEIVSTSHHQTAGS